MNIDHMKSDTLESRVVHVFDILSAVCSMLVLREGTLQRPQTVEMEN